MKSIIFNTEMVKAVLDGRRSQFRKVIRNIIATDGRYEGWRDEDIEIINGRVEIWTTLWRKIKAKYKVGDILYVREKSYFVDCDCQSPWQCSPQGWYATDEVSYSDIRCSVKTIPSVHMRKENARIFLKVTSVRVERLQDISVRNIEKETGWKREIYSYSNKNKAFYKDYRDLWNSTAKDGYKWEDNPYVFVYEFERINKED